MAEAVLVGIMIMLAGIIALEIGVPVAILEIVFGVIAFNLFGLQTNLWIDFLADIGVMGLMFFAGMEVDARILKRNLTKNILYGSSIYILRLISIITVSLLLFGFSLNTSILLGISLSTTSLALVYPVIKERGSISSPEGQLILSVAMIIDVSSTLSLLYFIKPTYDISIVAYVALGLALFLFAPRISKRFFSRYDKNLVEMEVRVIFLFLIIIGFLAEKLAISEVIFAFFLGMLLSNTIEERHDVEDKLRGIIFGFFSPIFFFKAGMLIDLRNFGLDALFYFVIFGIIAYAAAYLCVYLAFIKHDLHVRRCAGFVFNFRLTFGIIAALFGLEMGIITDCLYTVIVTIILSSSIISASALKFIPSPVLVE